MGAPFGSRLPDREGCVTRWVTSLRMRVRTLLFRSRADRDLHAELQYHLEREIEERLASGMTVEQARRSARLSLGSIDRSSEECRDAWGISFVEHRLQDLRFAVRQIRKHPVFAATAILVLAIGLGASATIFGFVDAALVRPLPYANPSQLFVAFTTRPDRLETDERGNVSYQDFLDWRRRSPPFGSLAAYDVRQGFTLATAEGPRRVSGLSVTSSFFRTLGVTPILGRDFSGDEEGPAAPARVMLSHPAWQRYFAGRADAVGRTVTLDGEPHVVIGVLPRTFHFALAESAEFWAAIRGRQYCWDHRDCWSLEVVGRVADDVTATAAADKLTAIARDVRREYPDAHRDPEVAKLVPLRRLVLGEVHSVLLALLGGAVLLLVIASINAVGLLLARSESRRREIGVRGALGASRRRLLLQFATEALVLAGAGSGLGLILAAFGIGWLRSLVPPEMISRMPYLQGAGLGRDVVLFSGAVALVATLVLALVPLARLPASRQLAGVTESSRGASNATWRAFGAPLATAELAIALVLLVGAGLLGKSLERALRVDVGFDPGGLVLQWVNPTASLPDEALGVLPRQVAERLRSLPGVQAVAYADRTPVAPGLAPMSSVREAGSPDENLDSFPVRRVSSGYFQALHARILRGRDFTEDEVALLRPVVILNDTAVRQCLHGGDPIGKAVVVGAPPAREVVGVVADIKDGPLEAPPLPAAYVPFDQSGAFAVVVRMGLGGVTALRSIGGAIHEVRPDLFIDGQTTMRRSIAEQPSASLRRASALLSGAFAAAALLLSVVGLYGVVAHSVGQRNREIGVRMALGAQRAAVYRMVLGEAAWMIGSATVVGLVGAATAAALMRPLLFGVQAWDGATMVSAVAVLGLSAFVASLVPASRAASVNPVEVLRTE